MGKIELLCLGTGDAHSVLYDNVPCTAFALLLDGYPVLLVGVGPGVLRAVVHYAHLVPECILLLNASLEQVNELSALVQHETNARRRIRIFASRDVCMTLGELMRLQLQDQPVPTDLVTLVSLPVTSGENEFFSLVHEFSVMLHTVNPTAGVSAGCGSSPSSCSALLCYRDQPIVAFSGPLGFDALLYAKLCQAPFVVVWASAQGGPKRASIYEIAAFSDKVNTTRRPEERVVFLIGGYGAPQDAPLLAGYAVLLHQGSPVVLVASEVVQSPFGALHLPLLNVRKSLPLKYPLNGKTTVLANDAVGAAPGSDATAYGGLKSPRASFSFPANGPNALTAAALTQQSSSTAAPQAPLSRRASAIVQQAANSDDSSAGGAHSPSHGAALTDTALRMANWVDPMTLDHLGAIDGHGGGKSSSRTGPYDTRKVFVFTNEDKGAPGRLLLLRNFRTLTQLEQRVAQMLSLKPIQGFHRVNGAVVRSLDELTDGCELIAVRRGGAPYNGQDLPRLLRSSSASSRAK